mmetsp:Transcript_37960/g.75283  ORF Transcript_37960/g.75283 Transcript_37960/m.75283 type:complete len:319 (-) Transcript_37960:305-1261(-)
MQSLEDLVEVLNGSVPLPGFNMTNASATILEDFAQLLHQSSELLESGGLNISKSLQKAEALEEKLDETLDLAFANVTEFLNSSLPSALANASEVIKDGLNETIEELGRPARLSNELKEQLQNLTNMDKKKIRREMLKSLNITDVVKLRPNVNLHDGNRCSDDEEVHFGLCYKKCGHFAAGKYPFRVSAWQCCKHEPPCEKSEIYSSGQPCSGLGVSGDSMGNGCPHSPGGCFKDEELFGNFCYLRCSILTYGVLPYRASPVACCNASRPLALLKAGCETDLRYDAGGGLGGGTGVGSRSMPNAPHPPMPILMERDGGW